MASILLLKSATPFLTTEKTLASLKPLNIIFGTLIMYFSPLGSSCITNVFEERLCFIGIGNVFLVYVNHAIFRSLCGMIIQ